MSNNTNHIEALMASLTEEDHTVKLVVDADPRHGFVARVVDATAPATALYDPNGEGLALVGEADTLTVALSLLNDRCKVPQLPQAHYDRIIAAMQPIEELGGIEDLREYRLLMNALVAECQRRLANAEELMAAARKSL